MSHAEPLTRIHQLLARQASVQPDAICLYEEGGGILTYAQLWQRAQAAAGWLAAAGVEPGHRVMMAVSYTHLDVYKRQCSCCSACPNRSATRTAGIRWATCRR